MLTLVILLGAIVTVGLSVMITLIITSSSRGSGGGVERPVEEEAPVARPATREERRLARAERVEDRRLPYRYLAPDGLILVHGRSVWTGISLPEINDEHQGDDKRAGVAAAQTHLLMTLSRALDQRVSCHLRVAARPLGVDRWVDQVVAKAPNPTLWYRKAIQRLADRLVGSAERDVVRVLMVRLGTVSARGDRAAAAAGAVTDVHEETLSEAEVAQWRMRAEAVQSAAAGVVEGVTPADAQTLVWLIRKPLYGHLPVPETPDLGRRAWGRGDFRLIAGMAGTNHRSHLRLVVDDGIQEQESYTAVMVLVDQPGEVKLHRETGWVRHALQFPGVDISHRFDILTPPGFKKLITDVDDDLHDEEKNSRKNGVPGEEAFNELMELSEQVRAMVDTGKVFGMLGSMQFVLAADDRQALDRACADFTVHMSNVGVTVHRPNRLQYRLIEGTLPGDAPRLAIAPWSRLTDLNLFAITLPSSGGGVGDRVQVERDGSRLGWVGRPIGNNALDWSTVFNDFHCGPARNKAAGIAVVGGSGGGKSAFAMESFHWESEAGRRCLGLDPKEDYAAMCYYLSFGPQVNEPGFHDEAAAGTLGTPGSRFQPVWPEYWADTEIIDAARALDGVADPFVVSRTIAEGVQLALAFLETVFDAPTWLVISRYLRAALEDMVDAAERDPGAPRPSMRALIDSAEAAHRAALAEGASETKADNLAWAVKELRSLSRAPFTRLAFGDGTRTLDALRKRRTVITLRGLPVPESTNIAEWNGTTRAGAGTLMLFLELANQMLANDDDAKAIYVDEAHVVTAFAAGRATLRNGIRVGRAYNTIITVISQQATDLRALERESDQGGANQFHEVFVFRQRSEGERRAALDLLALDPDSPADRESVSDINLRTGTCVYRDADNRTATVSIDLMWHELLAATQTNPDRRRAAQSRPLSIDVDEWTWIDEVDDTPGVLDLVGTEVA